MTRSLLTEFRKKVYACTSRRSLITHNILLLKAAPLLGGFLNCCEADAACLAELAAKRDSLSKELWGIAVALRSRKSVASGERMALEEKQVQLK